MTVQIAKAALSQDQSRRGRRFWNIESERMTPEKVGQGAERFSASEAQRNEPPVAGTPSNSIASTV